METLFFTTKCDRRLFLKVGVSSAAMALIGCATSAQSTWICSKGVCRGKGLILAEVDDRNTEVTIDSTAAQAAHDSGYFKDPLLTWETDLSVGVQEMDEEHIRLIYLANTLKDAMKPGNGNEVLGTIFGGLLSYTKTHFANEERLMAVHEYPELTSHKVIHANLVNQVVALKKQVDSGKPLISLNVLNFMRDWVKNHIQGTDKKYGVYMNARGVY
jgi:hemerythrin